MNKVELSIRSKINNLRTCFQITRLAAATLNEDKATGQDLDPQLHQLPTVRRVGIAVDSTHTQLERIVQSKMPTHGTQEMSPVHVKTGAPPPQNATTMHKNTHVTCAS